MGIWSGSLVLNGRLSAAPRLSLGTREVLHSVLQRLAVTGFELGVGLFSKLVEFSRSDVLVDLLVPQIRAVLVEPTGQLRQLVVRQVRNRGF